MKIDVTPPAVLNPDLGLSPDELMARYQGAAGERAGIIAARQARSVLPRGTSEAKIAELATALVEQSIFAFGISARTYKADPSGEPFLPFAVRRMAAATELYLRSHYSPRRLS